MEIHMIIKDKARGRGLEEAMMTTAEPRMIKTKKQVMIHPYKFIYDLVTWRWRKYMYIKKKRIENEMPRS